MHEVIPLLKDHLFIQSLEKEGQELLRGESAIGVAQWGGQLELELAHTGALAPSETKRRGGKGKGRRGVMKGGDASNRKRESPRL